MEPLQAGLKFGDWTTLGPWRMNKHYWHCALCRCICGTERFVHRALLHSGRSNGCGCKRYEKSTLSRTVHGHGKRALTSATYRAWIGAKVRCFNSASPAYANYGAVGITMCEEWRHDFPAFLRDMGERPSPRHSLDRFPDQRGNYEPANCRWAVPLQQHNNKRTNRLVTHEGETHTLAEWARMRGMSYTTLYERIKDGWEIADALNLPILPRSETRRGHRTQ